MKDKKNLRTIQTVLGDDVRTYFNIEGASVTSTLTARFVCADLDLNVELTLETLDDNLQK